MDKKNGNYRFFQNLQCEYFPCHNGVPKSEFNCLFCYCPLYALGKKCGGNFRYNERGFKVCTNCSLPHQRDGYDKVIARYGDIMAIAANMDEE